MATADSARDAASAAAATAVLRLTALTLAAVCCVALGWWSWSERGVATRSTAHEDAAALTADRAACSSLAAVITRRDTKIPPSVLDGRRPVSRGARGALRTELGRLDAISRTYPNADYYVLRSISGVADADALVLARIGYITFGASIAARDDAIAAARSGCAEVPGSQAAATPSDGPA